jgi:hypothetical protein
MKQATKPCNAIRSSIRMLFNRIYYDVSFS